MVVGNGMLARAFMNTFDTNPEVLVFAAGVSNSVCKDRKEFDRERAALLSTLDRFPKVESIVYFGTCSVEDTEVIESDYVQHKLRMEAIVLDQPSGVVFRLPQVAGVMKNRHTLLNFLFEKITNGERFEVWKNAYRNIIDVDDVVRLVGALLKRTDINKRIMNIASPRDYSILEIVQAMERTIGIKSIHHLVDRGTRYQIDVSVMAKILSPSDVLFASEYLYAILEKYWGRMSEESVRRNGPMH